MNDRYEKKVNEFMKEGSEVGGREGRREGGKEGRKSVRRSHETKLSNEERKEGGMREEAKKT